MNARVLILLRPWVLLLLVSANAARAGVFEQASQAYAQGDFRPAAELFRQAAVSAPASGVLHNLGNAEWQCGRVGPAVLAWERAQWLNPFNKDTRINLRFARKAAQLENPELTWYELSSVWLPVNAWPWVAAGSFWFAVSLLLLPGIFRWRKSEWYQGLAAGGFAIFLLTLPALAGVHTRSTLGVVLARDTPLRLTPTTEAQTLTKLQAGEVARMERTRGAYIFVRTATSSGWVRRDEFALIAEAVEPAPAKSKVNPGA